ncbi:MAG TPA: C25 family cysteine peptidase [Patescibacteria group bacterium]|nr:C25 family cysteine peptidase [Patescibacteria group bacterium]
MALAVSGSDLSTHFCVYFNAAYRPTSDWSTSCAAGKADVKSISLHELGHVLGLDDCLGCSGTVMQKPYDMSTPDCWSGPFDGDKSAVNSFCSNPAATVYGFSVSGGIARWRVTSQYETKSYIVEGAPAPGGPWQTVAEEPPTVGDHAVAVGSYAYYRLLEIERDGGMFIHGIVVDSQPAEQVSAEPPSIEELHAIIAERRAELLASPEPGEKTAAGDTMLIVTTDSLAGECSYGIADYWSLQGAVVSILTVDGFDPDPNVRRTQLRAAIVDAAGGGLDCVLFVGDANDHVQFDIAEEGPLWWPPSWGVIHDSYLTVGFPPGGQPDHDLIPAWYEPDTLPRRQNTAYTLPYVPYLAGYADVDGDAIPDIPWGCLPFTTAEQVAGYACKLWALEPTVSGASHVAFYICDRDYQFIGDGAVARAGAEAVEAILPPWVNRSHLYVTDYPDDGQRNTAAAGLWNGSNAGIHVLMGSYSNRYKPADFFDKVTYSNPWHMGMLAPYMNYYPLVIANSCGGGDWARTEDPQLGTPVLEEFLSACDRGALAWVGPSVGTWQHGAVLFGEYLIEELYADPARSMAASFLAAQRWMLEDPELDSPTRLVARSMCFFGDPLAPLNELAIVVAAERPEAPPVFALRQNVPNPFNPVTAIRYSIPEAGRVRLTVHDVAGRLVRTLVDEEQVPRAGGYTVTWNGTNDAGRPVASSVYFCRLSANESSQTKKMVVLK